MTHDEFLAETAKACRACPMCWDVPCAGCQAGGVCDEYCGCEGYDDDSELEDEGL